MRPLHRIVLAISIALGAGLLPGPARGQATPAPATPQVWQPTAVNLAMASGEPAVGRRVIAFVVPETGHGYGDLNGDGDATDSVYHTYRMAPGLLANLQLAGAQLSAHLDDGLLAFLVIEKHQGNTDLNGDGDTLDYVLHLHCPPTGLSTNLALASSAPKLRGGLPGLGDRPGRRRSQRRRRRRRRGGPRGPLVRA